MTEGRKKRTGSVTAIPSFHALALILLFAPMAAAGDRPVEPGDSVPHVGAREWTVNSSLNKSDGGWKGAARWWNWTGGKSGLSSPPNRVDWSGDGRIEFHAEDKAFDRFGAASDFKQSGPPLNMAEVEALFFEVTISGPEVPRLDLPAYWNGITAPAYFQYREPGDSTAGATEKARSAAVRHGLYLEIYLFGEGLNDPKAWAVMDPVGDGDRALKAVGRFIGVSTDHYMIRVTALPGLCRTVPRADGSTTYVIDVTAILREAVAKYNGFPYYRGYDLRYLEFHQAGTFAEAGLLTPAFTADYFGVPTATYTLHQYRVTYDFQAPGAGIR
jgi:hypothetical protein